MADEIGYYDKPQLYTNQQNIENILKRELAADEVAYLPIMIEAAGEVIRRYTGRYFMANDTPSDRFFDADNEMTKAIFIDDYISLAPQNRNWIFLVTGNGVIADVYTNNGFNYTVLLAYTNPLTAQRYLICDGVGTPTAGGILTKVSGSGDATIPFSSAGNHAALEVATLNVFDNQTTGTTIPPYSYIEDPLNTSWKNSIHFRGFPFAVGSRRFRVNAIWGFSKTAPGGIVQAATMLVMHMFENPQDLQIESIEGYSRTFAPKSTGEEDLIMPPQIKRMLDLYKKRSADL